MFGKKLSEEDAIRVNIPSNTFTEGLEGVSWSLGPQLWSCVFTSGSPFILGAGGFVQSVDRDGKHSER